MHLAARASTEGKTLDDFRDNTVGTANLLETIKVTPSVSQVVITSSQHVRKPGSGFTTDDHDYVPHGLYGESKVITEKLVHEVKASLCLDNYPPKQPYGDPASFFFLEDYGINDKGLAMFIPRMIRLFVVMAM